MESLGQALERAGFQVTIPLLPGHGTTVHEMDTTGFSLWYDAAEQAYLKLRRSADTVFVAGLSMGGQPDVALSPGAHAGWYCRTGHAGVHLPSVSSGHG